MCSVCLEDFEGEQQMMELSCSHKYHSNCLMPWLASHPHCPTCRNPVQCAWVFPLYFHQNLGVKSLIEPFLIFCYIFLLMYNPFEKGFKSLVSGEEATGQWWCPFPFFSLNVHCWAQNSQIQWRNLACGLALPFKTRLLGQVSNHYIISILKLIIELYSNHEVINIYN